MNQRTLIIVLLAAFFSTPSFSSETLTFFPDSKFRTIGLPNDGCDFIIDSSDNFRITKIQSSISIEAIGQTTRGALLIVSCPNREDQIYGLEYANRLLTAEDQTDTEPSQSQNTSFIENKIMHAGNDQTLWSLIWSDRSLPDAEVRFERSKSINGPTNYAEYQDILHRFSDEELIYYGTTYQERSAGSARAFRGGFQSHYISGGLERTFMSAGYRRDNYYSFLPGTLSVQLSGADDSKGGMYRSVSRNWVYRLDTLSSRTNVLGRITDGVRSSTITQTFVKTFAAAGQSLWLNQSTVAQCLEADGCKLAELGLGPAWKSGHYEGAFTHLLIPHALIMKLTWRPHLSRSASISYRKDLSAIPWLSHASLNSQNDRLDLDSRPKIEGDISLSLREGLFRSRIDYYQPIYPENERKQASVSFGLGEDRERIEWSVSLTQEIWNRRKPPSLLASIRLATEANIKRASLQLAHHQIYGKVISSITQKPLAGAKIKILRLGKTLSEATSEADGSYKITDIPKDGDFEIYAEMDHSKVTQIVQKDLAERTIQRDILIQDFLIVKVQFFLDTNNDALVDSGDSQLKMSNELPEIQDAIVRGDGAIIATDQLLFPRGKTIQLDIQPALLPVHFDAVGIYPREIDSIHEQTVAVTVLLKERK